NTSCSASPRNASPGASARPSPGPALPMNDQDLRALAKQQNVDPSTLLHEAYLRLVGDQHFDGRGHFFAACAEAMQRGLVDRARARARHKRGGGRERIDLTDIPGWADNDPDLLLSLDEALERLAAEDPAAAALGVSRATAYRNWTYARAWLQDALEDECQLLEPRHGERRDGP